MKNFEVQSIMYNQVLRRTYVLAKDKAHAFELAREKGLHGHLVAIQF